MIANDVQFKNLDERGCMVKPGENHMHHKHLLNKLNLELIKLEPEVVYDNQAFGRFLETNWIDKQIEVVEEESCESSPRHRGSVGSDPSPKRQRTNYQRFIDEDDKDDKEKE